MNPYGRNRRIKCPGASLQLESVSWNHFLQRIYCNFTHQFQRMFSSFKPQTISVFGGKALCDRSKQRAAAVVGFYRCPVVGRSDRSRDDASVEEIFRRIATSRFSMSVGDYLNVENPTDIPVSENRFIRGDGAKIGRRWSLDTDHSILPAVPRSTRPPILAK